MRLLAIDLGTKTMGLAVTDSRQVVANALENFTYSNNDLSICVNKVKALLTYYNKDVEKIILGYPKNINDTKNERTLLIERFHQILKTQTDLPIVLFDERYSTLKATGMMKFNVGLKASKIKKIKDKVSAFVILQEYMQTH